MCRCVCTCARVFIRVLTHLYFVHPAAVFRTKVFQECAHHRVAFRSWHLLKGTNADCGFFPDCGGVRWEGSTRESLGLRLHEDTTTGTCRRSGHGTGGLHARRTGGQGSSPGDQFQARLHQPPKPLVRHGLVHGGDTHHLC